MCVTSTYQENAGLNTSGRNLEKLLKLIAVQPRYNAILIIVHTIL
jgi:hypothetical protein